MSHELHLAASQGNLGLMRTLIQAGHAVNAFDEMGLTPLHHAVDYGRVEDIRLLLENGADVNARDVANHGNTALGEWAGECSVEVARILVEAGADPTIRGWMELSAVDRAEGRHDDEGPVIRQLLDDAARRHHPGSVR